MISDERFFAWLDGELDAADAAAVAALVEGDPALQRKAEAHRALAGQLHGAFETIAQAPVPARLLETARKREAEIVDFGAARERRRAPHPVSTQWAAMAATLAIGIVAGSMMDSGAMITRESGQLVASGDLEQALYTRLASAPADDGARIGLTFRDAAGKLCRSFTDAGAAGLACFDKGDWRIRGLFQAGEGQQAQYRMAAGPDPRLADLIGSAIAGEPLDASAERKALDSLR